MKLNHDCIRDIMLYMEQNLSYDNSLRLTSESIIEGLSTHAPDDIIYSLEKLHEAGYINAKKSHFMGTPYPAFFLQDISWEGHEFLDAIRDNSIWKQTTDKIKPFASVSLPIIQQVASSFLKQSLGL